MTQNQILCLVKLTIVLKNVIYVYVSFGNEINLFCFNAGPPVHFGFDWFGLSNLSVISSVDFLLWPSNCTEW